MTRTLRTLAFLILILFAAGVASAEPSAPTSALGYRVADPDAPPVTPKNLMASERFWPYRVSLTRAWKAPGRDKPLPVREAGILIRIEQGSGLARIDFGGLGVHEAPLDYTDLIENANKIRLGQLGKMAPNVVNALGPRLVDSAADPATGVQPESLLGAPGFLCVFANPDEEAFAAVAKNLAPLRGLHGVVTIVLPQARTQDMKVWQSLRSLGWQVPFVYSHLSEGYTDSLLPAKLKPPALLLMSAEGRLLFESRWSPEVVKPLRAKIDETFGGSVSGKAAPSAR